MSKAPAYQDLLNTLKSVVDLLENGTDGWGMRNYKMVKRNVLFDANEIIKLAEGE